MLIHPSMASSPLPWNPSQVLFWMQEWAEQWAHLDGEDIMRRLINFVFLVDYVFLFLSGARRGHLKSRGLCGNPVRRGPKRWPQSVLGQVHKALMESAIPCLPIPHLQGVGSQVAGRSLFENAVTVSQQSRVESMVPARAHLLPTEPYESSREGLVARTNCRPRGSSSAG